MARIRWLFPAAKYFKIIDHLADAGADVVKVEPPEGDPRRHRRPFAGDRPGPQSSLSFAHYHADKRGVVLDYRLPEAAAALADLGANADVLVLTPTVRATCEVI